MEDVKIREFLAVSSGDGYGYGYGYGLKSINKMQGHIIDGVQTIITSVRGNVAKGYLVMSDLSLVETFVVKQGNIFAHGANLHEAQQALRDKLFEDMSEEERIAAFVAEHEWDKAYPAQNFFDWHHRLTGSCLMGRRAFVSDHDLSMDRKYTVDEFISLTKDAHGGDVIRKIPALYGIEQ